MMAITVPDISAGQFSYFHPTDVIITPQNAASEILDVDIDKIGLPSKRKGYVLIADDLGSVGISGGIGFSPAGGNRYLLNESNGVVSTWQNSGNWTPSKTGLTAATVTNFVVAKNLVFRLGQTDNIWSFDGSSWTDEGDTNTDFPKAKMAIWTSSQRMLAVNSSASPHFLWYSDAKLPQTWDRTTNAFTFGKNDAIGITGLLEFTNYEVIVWTQDAMYLLYINDATPGNWTTAKIADIGCIAHRTPRQIGGDVLFLSKDGVRSVLQSQQDKKRGASLPLSYPIQDWIQRINWQYVDNAVAWSWQDKYYLSLPIDSSTYNNYTFVFSRRAFEANQGKGGWTIYRNCNFNAFMEQTFSNLPTRLYTGEASADGKAYLFRSLDPDDEATNDNGTAITFSVTGKRYDFGAPDREKSFAFIEVTVINKATGSIKVEAQIDGGGYTTLGTFSQAGDIPTLPQTLPFGLKGANKVRQKYDLEQLGRGRNIQVRITESTKDAPVELIEYLIAGFIEEIQFEE
jgi:hypothetical protein